MFISFLKLLTFGLHLSFKKNCNKEIGKITLEWFDIQFILHFNLTA